MKSTLPLTQSLVRKFLRRRGLTSPAEDVFSYPHVVDVSDLASRMRQDVRQYAAAHPMRMVGVLAEAAPPYAELYSDRIAETFAEDDIDYQVRQCRGETPDDVAQLVRELNRAPDVHGILVFYPIFKHRAGNATKGPYLNRSTGVYYKSDDDWLRDVVCPEKDVEGLSHQYSSLFRARGRNRDDVYIPCTAMAVMQILQAYHPHASQSSGAHRWSGSTITIVNRSEILGRPLAAMLALEGANVYSVDDASILWFQPGGTLRRSCWKLEACLRESSIVVTGVPDPAFKLPIDAIQPGTTIVDVSEFDNVGIEEVGQVDGVQLIPSVGKVTIAALEQNFVRLHQSQCADASD